MPTNLRLILPKIESILIERLISLGTAILIKIAVIYIDGVALTTRMYAKAGQGVNVYVVDGNLTVDNIKITK